jgi:hypothetical protein
VFFDKTGNSTVSKRRIDQVKFLFSQFNGGNTWQFLMVNFPALLLCPSG